jgi:antitoxin component of RelBE/YafQ-DinJ toxin-antitoxin module
MDSDHLHLRIRPLLKQQVEDAAKRMGLTPSTYVRLVLAERLGLKPSAAVVGRNKGERK